MNVRSFSQALVKKLFDNLIKCCRLQMFQSNRFLLAFEKLKDNQVYWRPLDLCAYTWKHNLAVSTGDIDTNLVWHRNKGKQKRKVKLMQINMANMRLEHMSHNLSEQTEGARAESDSYSFLNKWWADRQLKRPCHRDICTSALLWQVTGR